MPASNTPLALSNVDQDATFARLVQERVSDTEEVPLKAFLRDLKKGCYDECFIAWSKSLETQFDA